MSEEIQCEDSIEEAEECVSSRSYYNPKKKKIKNKKIFVSIRNEYDKLLVEIEEGKVVLKKTSLQYWRMKRFYVLDVSGV